MGVRVERANLPPEVYVWGYIRIRGIASMRKTGTFHQLLIRPRTAGDVTLEPVE